MSVLRILRFCVLLFSAISIVFAQGAPDIGQWIAGPFGNRHDLVPDAVSSAQLGITGAQAPLTNQAAVFLACKGNDAGTPTPELRFLIPLIRGFNITAVEKLATLAIGDQKSTIPLDVFPVQNSSMFVVTPSPAGLKQIASLRTNQRENLYLYFRSGGRQAFFVTILEDPTGPVSAVLKACNVSIPEAAPPPPNSVTPAMSKYTFLGIHLGMTAQQTLTAERAIATTPIKPSPGGGVDFETAQFYFISVSAGDDGLLEFYKVCGKASDRAQSGPRSGPLYATAVKAFGPATGKPSNGQTWVQWDTSGGVDARYEWDSDEEPGGCLFVSRAKR